MVMDKLGKRVSEYPKATIVTNVIITLIAVGCILIIGLEQEFSEESFMPENEMVQASDEISAEYTSTAQVSILVKSKNDDLLTRNGLLEIMQIEQQIINDDKVRPNLENPNNTASNVNSIVDIIAQMAFLQYNASLENLSDNEIKQLIFGLLSSNETSPQIKGMFSFMLTKDFNPLDPNGIKAKGTMIIFIMNRNYYESWIIDCSVYPYKLIISITFDNRKTFKHMLFSNFRHHCCITVFSFHSLLFSV